MIREGVTGDISYLYRTGVGKSVVRKVESAVHFFNYCMHKDIETRNVELERDKEWLQLENGRILIRVLPCSY